MGPPGAFQASDRGVRLSRAAPKKIKNIKCYRLEAKKGLGSAREGRLQMVAIIWFRH